MSEQSEQEKRPWYREWGLWLVLAPLILVVCVSSTMVAVALVNADDVVIDNYYKEGRMINQSLDQDTRAAQWGLSAELKRTADGLVVDLHSDSIPLPPTLSLWLDHPFEEDRDLYRVLERGDDGAYRAQVPPLEHHWYFTLSPEQAQDKRREAPWRLRAEVNFDRHPVVHMTPPEAKDAAP